MLKRPAYMTIFASLYLLVFVIFIQLNVFFNLVHVLFLCSPIVVITLMWRILRYGNYKGKEFTKDQHWGYQDRPGK